MKEFSSSKKTLSVLPFILILIYGMSLHKPSEGMFPLSEIGKINLTDAGLKISKNEIYNPDGVSLIDALVKVGGCTGSFVSPEGLILTNYHCAFNAIAANSTPEMNLTETGFLADSKIQEIPAAGYTCRITESYLDVSDIILKGVEQIEDLTERSKTIKKRMNELAENSNDESRSIVAQVSEMFEGKTYVLFKYRIIRDVRLVYAPPQSIGEFGGETDNWIWPRHTGDFTFLRAYVDSNGSAASYSPDNVPYVPRKHLKVSRKGVNEGDFVFLLGYPGRTYRQKPSQFIKYQQEYQLPFISDIYSWMIDKYDEIGQDNIELQLKFASIKDGLANTMKNYKGKLKGLRKLDLVNTKQKQEDSLKSFINSDPSLQAKYSSLFPSLDEVYKKINESAQANLWFQQLYRRSSIIYTADFLTQYFKEMSLPEDKRSPWFSEDNIENTKSRLFRILFYHNNEFEEDFLTKMFLEASDFSDSSRIQAVDNIVKEGETLFFIEKFVNNNITNQRITERNFLDSLFSIPADELQQLENPLLELSSILSKQKDKLDKKNSDIEGSLNILSAQLLEVKKAWSKESFIPDANGTLRLTYGSIKGYSPADAVYHSPITTLEGVIEKNRSGLYEYRLPPVIDSLYKTKDYSSFGIEEGTNLPVAILYNTDTTGGNSGSPILNAYGELVGLNFDRAFEATINDYAWDDSYSRSIGVDIRYVLWITQKVGKADYLIEEMGI